MEGGDGQYEKLQQFGNNKIGKYEISKTPFVMCIRQSMRNYLKKLNELMSFEDGVLFYAMWKGYMEHAKTAEFLEFMEQRGVKIHILHTSGHADEKTIERLIEVTKPGIIIPVHTENPAWYGQFEGMIVLDSSIITL